MAETAREFRISSAVVSHRPGLDRHKGIAHQLPDMTGIDPGRVAPPDLRGDDAFRPSP